MDKIQERQAELELQLRDCQAKIAALEVNSAFAGNMDERYECMERIEELQIKQLAVLAALRRLSGAQYAHSSRHEVWVRMR